MIRVGAAFVWAVAVVLAVFGPLLAPVIGLPSATDISATPFEPASGEHVFGTDRLGRDIAAHMLSGNAVLVVVPLVAACLASAAGLVVGSLYVMVPQWARGVTRTLLDALLVVPPIVIMLAIAASTGLSAPWLIGASVVLALPLSSRFFEATAQRVLAAGFIELARCRGDGWARIVVREVAPVLARPFATDVSLRFVATVYLTATASFLGAGVGDGSDTWATLIQSGLSGVMLNPWGVAAPALAIMALTVPLSVLSFGGGDV